MSRLDARPDSGRALRRQAYYLWTVLSRAGHHHPYELGITAAELTRLRTELIDIVTLLDHAHAPTC